MMNQIENRYMKIIRGEEKGLAATVFKILLHPFSWIYGTVSFLRNAAYDLGLLPAQTFASQAVISIGNITVGGTGKTPVTMMIGREFSPRFSTAILSRGYRSCQESKKTPLILSCGMGPEYPASVCGDEPYLLADNLPHTTVCVGKDRCTAAEMVVNLGAELVILDDGLQHRKIARDLEVIVMDASDPFGQGYYLPRGLLRDDIRTLQRADLIILNNVTSEHQHHYIQEALSNFTNAPVVGTHMNTTMWNLDGTPALHLKGAKVGMFCGIGNPTHFVRTLEEQGFDVIEQMRLVDHGHISENDLLAFASQCKASGADFIVCTEKDKVKLSSTAALPLPLIWVKIELQVDEGIEHWRAFINKAETTIIKKSGKRAA